MGPRSDLIETFRPWSIGIVNRNYYEIPRKNDAYNIERLSMGAGKPRQGRFPGRITLSFVFTICTMVSFGVVHMLNASSTHSLHDVMLERSHSSMRTSIHEATEQHPAKLVPVAMGTPANITVSITSSTALNAARPSSYQVTNLTIKADDCVAFRQKNAAMKILSPGAFSPVPDVNTIETSGMLCLQIQGWKRGSGTQYRYATSVSSSDSARDSCARPYAHGIKTRYHGVVYVSVCEVKSVGGKPTKSTPMQFIVQHVAKAALPPGSYNKEKCFKCHVEDRRHLVCHCFSANGGKLEERRLQDIQRCGYVLYDKGSLVCSNATSDDMASMPPGQYAQCARLGLGFDMNFGIVWVLGQVRLHP